MNMQTAKIFVSGHRGMVGQAVVRALRQRGAQRLLVRERGELNLLRQTDVEAFFKTERPDAVVFAAARVGGIHANDTYPADFIYENLQMANNAIHAAYQSGTKHFLFLGSTCIYPRNAPQPMSEDCLLTGPLEPTNEAYALAKIAGLKMCQFYRRQHGVLFHSAMPTNLYGPGDNYHPENSHVLPALLRRFHEACESGARQVAIWGSGTPRREFLHVDDLAAAILHLIELPNPPDWVNVGTGLDLSIADLAVLVARTVGYEGEIVYDRTKPDGTPVKRTDISKITASGWRPRISLEEGLRATYADYLKERTGQKLREV
ncbi:MAG: GDP-L-fucose synthase [Pirellulaceae bacterium]